MNKHKNKVKLARKMRSNEEIKSRTPIFQTKAWEARKARKAREVAKREARAKEASRLRKEREKNGK